MKIKFIVIQGMFFGFFFKFLKFRSEIIKCFHKELNTVNSVLIRIPFEFQKRLKISSYIFNCVDK